MNTDEIFIAGASVRAAAESAARAGFSVIAADLFADTDTQAAAASCVRIEDYPDDLIRVRKQHAHLPAIYTGAIENYPDLVNEFANAGALWGNRDASIRRLRDPMQLQHTMEQNRIPFPQTSTTRPPDDRNSWLVKSVRSAGGQHVRRLNEENKVSREGEYFQEHIDGQACSASFVAIDGEAKLLGVTEMLVGCAWLGASGFTYCGSATRSCSPEETRQWKHIGEVIAEEFELTGVFGVDGIVQEKPTPAEVIPIEVNPRYTASMEIIEITTGESVLAQHAQAFGVSAPLTRQTPAIPKAAKAILYAHVPLAVPNELTSTNPQIAYADLPVAGKIIDQGHPILSIIARLNDTDTPWAQLRSAALVVRQQFIESPRTPMRA